MKRIRIEPDAEQDLSDICSWYEEQNEGVGGKFLDQFRATTNDIAQNPTSYPVPS